MTDLKASSTENARLLKQERPHFLGKQEEVKWTHDGSTKEGARQMLEAYKNDFRRMKS